MKSFSLAMLVTGLAICGCGKREEPVAPPPPPAPSPVRESRTILPPSSTTRPEPVKPATRPATPLPPDILEKYRKAANDNDERARLIDEVAMNSLDGGDAAQTVKVYGGMLQAEQTPELKVSILDELGMLEFPAALSPIMSVLSSNPPDEVRDAATSAAESVLSALSFQQDKGAVDQVIQLLDAKYPSQLRESAINALEDLADKRAVTALQRLLNDPDEAVRTAAQSAIDSLQEK